MPGSSLPVLCPDIFIIFISLKTHKKIKSKLLLLIMHEETIPVIKMILEFDQNFELISCQNLFLVF